jgi:hypothetical protein
METEVFELLTVQEDDDFFFINGYSETVDSLSHCNEIEKLAYLSHTDLGM